MKNKKGSVIFIIIILLLFQSCSTRDAFYSHGSGLDYLRFPLIKPYYALTLTHGEPNWNILLEFRPPLLKETPASAITGIEKISVNNGVILVYSHLGVEKNYKDLKGNRFHYFVINTHQNTEMGFEEEEDFLDYVNENRLVVKWSDPLTILQAFDQTRCLEWIPGCD